MQVETVEELVEGFEQAHEKGVSSERKRIKKARAGGYEEGKNGLRICDYNCYRNYAGARIREMGIFAIFVLFLGGYRTPTGVSRSSEQCIFFLLKLE